MALARRRIGAKVVGSPQKKHFEFLHMAETALRKDDGERGKGLRVGYMYLLEAALPLQQGGQRRHLVLAMPTHIQSRERAAMKVDHRAGDQRQAAPIGKPSASIGEHGGNGCMCWPRQVFYALYNFYAHCGNERPCRVPIRTPSSLLSRLTYKYLQSSMFPLLPLVICSLIFTFHKNFSRFCLSCLLLVCPSTVIGPLPLLRWSVPTRFCVPIPPASSSPFHIPMFFFPIRRYHHRYSSKRCPSARISTTSFHSSFCCSSSQARPSPSNGAGPHHFTIHPVSRPRPIHGHN